jgi:hypothetical protein
METIHDKMGDLGNQIQSQRDFATIHWGFRVIVDR